MTARPSRASRVATSLLAMTAALLGGCPSETDGSSTAGGSSPSTPSWQVVFDDGALDRALLSVWGTSSTSVYAVGGPLGNEGFEALALHFDGAGWTELSPGGSDSFWWVTGTSDDDVWMVGENGRITHFDGQSFDEHDSGTTATLWGAIAFGPTDVWVVGGTPGGEPSEPDDVILRYDGTTWAPVSLPGEPLGRALFKIWGTSSDALFIVGEAGLVWRKSGPEFVLDSDPPIASGNLFTVHGCSPSEVYAVGGRDLLRFDGGAWSRVDRPLSNDVSGVHCANEGAHLAIVGSGGLKQRRFDGSWSDDFTSEPHADLHAVWIDETDAVWAVGGDFVSKSQPGKPRNGIVTRYAADRVPSTLR
jgi:hypothetical protein